MVIVVSHSCTDFFFSVDSLAEAILPPVSLVSPLNVEEFTRELAGHLNQQLVTFVLQGLRRGFKLGFHSSQKLRSLK